MVLVMSTDLSRIADGNGYSNEKRYSIFDAINRKGYTDWLFLND